MGCPEFWSLVSICNSSAECRRSLAVNRERSNSMLTDGRVAVAVCKYVVFRQTRTAAPGTVLAVDLVGMIDDLVFSFLGVFHCSHRLASHHLVGLHQAEIENHTQPEGEERPRARPPGIGEANVPQYPDALASEDEIDQRESSARLEQANHLPQHLLPLRPAVYFVDHEIG